MGAPRDHARASPGAARVVAPKPLAVMRYVQYFLSVAGARFAAMLLSAATFPFLVRVIGVEGFGRWSYVLAVVGFFDLVVNPGLVAYASREVAVHRTGANVLVSEVFTLRAALGVAGALLLTAYALGVESDRATQGLLLVYGVPFLLVGALQSSYLLTSSECFHWASMQQVVAQGAYAIAVFALIRTDADLVALALISLGSLALSTALGWIKLAELGYRLRWTWAPTRFFELLRQSLPLGAAALASQVYTRSGHVIVRWALGETALGLYAAVVRLAEVIFSFVGIFFGLLMPRMALSSSHDEKRRKLAQHGFVLAWTVSVPLAVGGSVLAPDLAASVLGPGYEAGGRLFRVVSFYFLTNSLATFFAGTLLYALGLRHQYLLATTAGAIFGISVNALLIPLMGISIACISYVCSQLVVAAVASKLAPSDLSGLWRGRLVATPVVGSFVMAATLVGLGGGGMNVWLEVALGAVIYASVILAVARRELATILRRKASS